MNPLPVPLLPKRKTQKSGSLLWPQGQGFYRIQPEFQAEIPAMPEPYPGPHLVWEVQAGIKQVKR